MATLTLKQNSKNSLKQWVNKIKRYEAQLPLLYEKLEYLEVRSIGYNSPSFEPRLSSNGSSSYKGIDYWLEKIDACERQIAYYERELMKYTLLIHDLGELESNIFSGYCLELKSLRNLALSNKISVEKVNKVLKSIWDNKNICNK